MADTKYSYSIASDIVLGAVESGLLEQEVLGASFAPTLMRIDTVDDELDIWFADGLSAAEKTTLDGDATEPAGGIIGAHDAASYSPPNENRRIEQMILIQSDTQPFYLIKKTFWQVAGRIRFRGTDDMGAPLALKAVMSAEPGGEASARIYDLTNDVFICAGGSTTSEQPVIVDLGTPQNLPAAEAVWELQVTRTVADGRLHSLSIDYP